MPYLVWDLVPQGTVTGPAEVYIISDELWNWCLKPIPCLASLQGVLAHSIDTCNRRSAITTATMTVYT